MWDTFLFTGALLHILIKKGEYYPSFLNHVKYDCKIFITDKPFLAFHREHGNIVLMEGEYMIVSMFDTRTLDKVID